MVSLSDNEGNILEVNENVITLILRDKSRHKIGAIIPNQRVLEVVRKKDVHTLIKGNAYGFNHHILSQAKRFDKVRLTDEDGVYLIPITTILQWGFFLHFKTQGFERQIFLDKEIIKNHKIKPYV